jgi:hypothetical protein
MRLPKRTCREDQRRAPVPIISPAQSAHLVMKIISIIFSSLMIRVICDKIIAIVEGHLAAADIVRGKDTVG